MKPTHILRAFLLAAGSSLLAVSPASADQTWDGGSATDSNWNTADNWGSNTLPNFANQIIFAGTTRTATVNNLTPDTTIGGFNFTNLTSGQTFSTSGNRITLGGDFVANQFTSGGNFPVANTEAFGLAMILNGNRIFNIGQRRLINFSGIISETGGARTLTKQGTGQMSLNAANTYSGATTISGGLLTLGNSLAMQNSALDTTASIAGTSGVGLRTTVTTLTLGGLTGNKNFAPSGGVFTSFGVAGGGYSSVTALTLNPGTGASHSYSGVIANGAANMTLTKTGAGNQTLTNTNTYTGLTRIDAGTLTLGHATNTISGAVNVNGGELALGTNTDTVGAVTLTSGSITGSGAGTLTGTSYDVRSGTISAKLGGLGVGLTKTTGGTVTISSDNSVGGYTGTTAVNDGTLIVNGNISTSVTTTVASGATLGGSGTLGATTISGTHSPGNSPGIINHSSLTYEAGSNVVWELVANSTADRGTNFDGINVTGALTFNGATTLGLDFDFGISAVEWQNAFWESSYTGTSGWLLYDGATSLTGFSNLGLNSPTAWLDESGDTLASIRPGSSFGLHQDGNDIYITYTAIPEPGAALLGSLGLLALLRRRR